MSYYSKVSYTGDGSTATFSVPFPYIDKAHVSVTVNGVAATISAWPTSSTLTLSPAPANGATIWIERTTPRSSLLVTWPTPSDIKASKLNLAATQALYIIQEAFDSIASSVAGEAAARAAADASITTTLTNETTDRVNQDATLVAYIISEQNTRGAQDGILQTAINVVSAAISSLRDRVNILLAGGIVLAFSGYIDPRDAAYGAAWNGVTDDTVALNNALTMAIATGRPLLIPPGTGVAQISRATTAKVQIVGLKGASFIKSPAVATCIHLDKTNADSQSLILKDFTVLPAAGALVPGRTAINLVQANGCIVENVDVIGDNKFDTGIKTSLSAGLKIRDGKMQQVRGWGIDSTADWSAQHQHIKNVIFYGCGEALGGGGISCGVDQDPTHLPVATGGLVLGLHIDHCDFGLTNINIRLKDVASAVISGNYMEDTLSGLPIQYLTSATGRNKGIVHQGNHINNALSFGVGAGSKRTWQIDYLDKSIFVGNDFINVDVAFTPNNLDNRLSALENNIPAPSTVTFADGANVYDWDSATPTVTPTGGPGAFAASSSVKTYVDGKVCFFEGSITITNAGTGVTSVHIDLPVAPAGSVTINGTAGSGASCKLYNLGAGATVIVYDTAGNALVGVETLRFNGSYRVA